jgi:hypothetical protein
MIAPAEIKTAVFAMNRNMIFFEQYRVGNVSTGPPFSLCASLSMQPFQSGGLLARNMATDQSSAAKNPKKPLLSGFDGGYCAGDEHGTKPILLEPRSVKGKFHQSAVRVSSQTVWKGKY